MMRDSPKQNNPLMSNHGHSATALRELSGAPVQRDEEAK